MVLHRSLDNSINCYIMYSIFYMYIDIGVMIAGKQDGPSMNIEGPPGPPMAAKESKMIFFYTL